MSYTAIFIGGAFDMTKRNVVTKEVDMFFYEPVTRLRPCLSRIPQEESILCRTLVYMLSGETPQGVLIYEYTGVRGDL